MRISGYYIYHRTEHGSLYRIDSLHSVTAAVPQDSDKRKALDRYFIY
jgi:hypothetical protein